MHHLLLIFVRFDISCEVSHFTLSTNALKTSEYENSGERKVKNNEIEKKSIKMFSK